MSSQPIVTFIPKRPFYLERIGMTPESVRDLRAPHPSWARFLKLLHDIGFADLFDWLCARHPYRGPETPVHARHEALAESGRQFLYQKRGKYWIHREKHPERVVKRCGIGLDVRIDARVEMELLFATPLGHLGYNWPRLARHARRVSEPDYKPSRKNPAPRIQDVSQLPAVIADCLYVYDIMHEAIRRVDWEVP